MSLIAILCTQYRDVLEACDIKQTNATRKKLDYGRLPYSHLGMGNTFFLCPISKLLDKAIKLQIALQITFNQSTNNNNNFFTFLSTTRGITSIYIHFRYFRAVTWALTILRKCDCGRLQSEER